LEQTTRGRDLDVVLRKEFVRQGLGAVSRRRLQAADSGRCREPLSWDDTWFDLNELHRVTRSPRCGPPQTWLASLGVGTLRHIALACHKPADQLFYRDLGLPGGPVRAVRRLAEYYVRRLHSDPYAPVEKEVARLARTLLDPDYGVSTAVRERAVLLFYGGTAGYSARRDVSAWADGAIARLVPGPLEAGRLRGVADARLSRLLSGLAHGAAPRPTYEARAVTLASAVGAAERKRVLDAALRRDDELLRVALTGELFPGAGATPPLPGGGDRPGGRRNAALNRAAMTPNRPAALSDVFPKPGRAGRAR
jgi:hypothetical protein